MTHHRSRVVQFVIDVDNLDRGVAFWSAALDATEEPLSEQSRHVYRLLRLPDAEIRVLLQRTHDEKVSKERMHLDLETDDVEAEVRRLEALGATRYDHQQERGFDFWVMRDPWGNEFCVLQPNFPELLARRRPWTTWGGVQWLAQSSAHRLLHERGGPCLDVGGQLLQREGGRPHGAFVEVRRVVEAERRVPRVELRRRREVADDLAVLGVGGHPVPGFRREGWGAGLMIAWSRSAMARSGSGISAILASTAPSPSALPARGPRRASAFSSSVRSFIAARSSSEKPADVLSVAVVPLADCCVSVIAGSLPCEP
jgi:predicted enzyme related to lactoylglutathione lyase